MKIALCSSFVPFISGGYRFIVEWLKPKLEAYGHQVEIIYLPQVDSPDTLLQQMLAYRWIDLAESADRIICFRPSTHLIPHPNKILWFIHHVRIFYDLWDTKYCLIPHTEQWQAFRQALMDLDTRGLQEAKQIFTNSQCVSNRLKHYNGVDSEVLYPPLFDPSPFHYHTQNDEIVYICRVEGHKRQELLVQAMKYTRTPVKLRLCGQASSKHYAQQIQDHIKENNLQNKVIFDHRWISESEKVTLLANALAAAYLPLDEDSYGYPSLEASHSSKPIITTRDAGGVLELITDLENGFVCEPEPVALAAAMDELYTDRQRAKKMGQAAHERISQLNIAWPHVIERLLS